MNRIYHHTITRSSDFGSAKRRSSFGVGVYLDYAASTPVAPRVLAAMKPYFGEKFGNAGSFHSFGQEAMAAADKSRETIARAIGADFREVVFTGSATEANNLALRGAVRGFTQMTTQMNADKNIRENQRHIDVHPRPRLIVSAIEHESVLETARDLENDGVEVIYLPVDRCGIVDLKKMESALNERTILVSVMYAQNEIGTIQPLFEIKKIIDDFKNRNFQFSRLRRRFGGQAISNLQKNAEFSHRSSVINYQLPLFHTDAAQAFQFLDCDVGKLGVDLMTLSSHKIYGPKGVGALYVRQETRDKRQDTRNKQKAALPLSSVACCLSPIITGGGQEFGLRSGTENVPIIVGFAKATELIFSNSQEYWNKEIMKLRDYFWQGLVKICPTVEVNGPPLSTNCESSTNIRIYGGRVESIRKFAKNSLFVNRLPNILNVYFPGHDAQFLLTKLDLVGVAASAGSACRSRAFQPSYVIEALGYSKERAKQSVRFSFGRPTTKKEIDESINIIKNSI